MADLGRIHALRRTGSEPFTDGPNELPLDLLCFWQWSGSDLVLNTARGVVAEFLVASALGINVHTTVRDAWAPYDLQTPSGTKVEVKSAAYIQSWHQTMHSVVSFHTPKTQFWNADTNQFEGVAKRHSDVYVFALLAHREKATTSPLDVSQWDFYVLPTRVLDERVRSQASITLPTLRGLAHPLKYHELEEAVHEAALGAAACPKGTFPPK
jgi:hypothetical protein